MRIHWLYKAFCPETAAAVEEAEACGRKERRERGTGRGTGRKG